MEVSGAQNIRIFKFAFLCYTKDSRTDLEWHKGETLTNSTKNFFENVSFKQSY